MATKAAEISAFRKRIGKTYANTDHTYRGGFDELLCYEMHTQPVNPRMNSKTMNDGFETGLTFKELAHKWGISVTFLGELIADHCRRLDGPGGIMIPIRFPDADYCFQSSGADLTPICEYLFNEGGGNLCGQGFDLDDESGRRPTKCKALSTYLERRHT